MNASLKYIKWIDALFGTLLLIEIIVLVAVAMFGLDDQWPLPETWNYWIFLSTAVVYGISRDLYISRLKKNTADNGMKKWSLNRLLAYGVGLALILLGLCVLSIAIGIGGATSY